MKYCLGQLKSSPWSELDGLQPETKIIDEQLASINLKGFLTINSQPAVNGAKSDSPSIGKILFITNSLNWVICFKYRQSFMLLQLNNRSYNYEK